MSTTSSSSNMTSPDTASLIEASSFFIDRGFCGLVWLDADLMVRERAGGLVDFVSLDKPLGRAIVALHGCDGDAHALRAGTRRRLEVSNVRIVTAACGSTSMCIGSRPASASS